ncbi:MAG: hypothetical protein LR000_02275 [Candidatus Pacebacteria bacterium]|nr:hypothetical protein [Candidatus Paceibacterota bacterium]
MPGNKIVTKEEIENLKKIPGNVKGAVILADLEYVRRKGGMEAQGKIQRRLKELGFNISLKEIKPMSFYPEYLSVTVILLAKEVLHLDDDGIFEMGKTAPKLSIFIKLLTKFFASVERCFKETPKYWAKHFDFGEIETVEFNPKKKYAIIRVRGYKFHPIMCVYHKGYFLEIAQLALGKRPVKIAEIRCMFKGDPYHEYKISWE